MLSLIHYISASRRLEESEKTIRMLGGENYTPPMFLAQRDMIKHEKEYYLGEVQNLAIYLVVLAFFSSVVYTILYLKGWL